MKKLVSVFDPHIFLLFILFILSAQVVYGQSRNLPELDFDQFRRDVNSLESPEEKLAKYVDMSLNAVRYKPDSLFVFAEEIKQLPGLEVSKQQAFHKFILANAWRAFDRDSSIYYGTSAAEQLKQIGEHSEYLRTKNLLGLEYSRKPDYVGAEAAYLEGIAYSESVDSSGYPVQYFYGNLGNLYSTVGAHDLAAKMFETFLEYEDNDHTRCNILSRLAGSLMEMEELEKASQMLSPCLEYPDLPPPIRAIVRSNLSEIIGKMGEKEYSLRLMEEAAFISEKNRIPNLHIAHLVRLGNQYLDMNLVQKADSIRFLMENSSFGGLNQNFRIEKALFLSDLALANGHFEQSLAYADTAIETASAAGLEHFLGQVYETKAGAYEKMGELDQAVYNLRLQKELEELMNSRDEKKHLAMMKVRYQLQHNENKLAAVSNQLLVLANRNILLIFIAMSIALTGGFIFYRYKKSRASEQVFESEVKNRDVTISNLEKRLSEQNQKLKERNIPEWVEIKSQVKLSLDEIRYIKSEGNYIKIFLSDTDRTPIMERMTLKECEEVLPDEIYLRIHRSTLINLRHASHINNEILYLKDNTELKISRRYKKEVETFLN